MRPARTPRLLLLLAIPALLLARGPRCPAQVAEDVGIAGDAGITGDAGAEALDTGPVGWSYFPFYTETEDVETGERHEHSMGLWHRWTLEGGLGDDGPVSGRRSTWLLPFWFDKEEGDRFVTVGFPLYYQWGRSDSWFGMGLPLYWASYELEPDQSEPDGFSVLFPFYWHLYSPGARARFFLPFYGYRTYPGAEIHYLLGPLLNFGSYTDLDGEPAGAGVGLLSPLIEIESRENGYDYRFLPFFRVSKSPGREDLLASPFYYQAESSTGDLWWILPFHASARNLDETWNLWAAGLYMNWRTANEGGDTTSSRHDALWSLISYSHDRRSETTHVHVLPAIYWSTSTPTGSRTVGGPFLYAHDLEDEDENRSRLLLVLGNVWLSSLEERPTRPSVAATLAASREPSAEVDLVESARDHGVFWPLSRWYRDDQGSQGQWVMPFYSDTRTDTSAAFAAWPFAYTQEDVGSYELNYFRYFFLFNTESWAGGSRLSIAQLLFDWSSESNRDREHFSFLFPLFEVDTSAGRTEYHVNQIAAGSHSNEGGERTSSYRLFPFFWMGSIERVDAAGEWEPREKHFYILPFYGYEARTTKVDHYALYPILHFQQATESARMDVWPVFFWRDNPTRKAWAVWPLHANESGEGADDSWVRRFLFFSKRSSTPSRSAYRLDPFLWSYSRDDNRGTSDLSVLFSIYQRERAGEDVRHTLFWFLGF